MMVHQQLRAAGAICREAAAQQRYPLAHIGILGLNPAAINRSHRAPPRGVDALGIAFRCGRPDSWLKQTT